MSMKNLMFGDRETPFSGHASVINGRGYDILVSYSTCVVCLDKKTGKKYRLWEGMTTTTAMHIRKIAGLSLKSYRALPFARLVLDSSLKWVAMEVTNA